MPLKTLFEEVKPKVNAKIPCTKHSVTNEELLKGAIAEIIERNKLLKDFEKKTAKAICHENNLQKPTCLHKFHRKPKKLKTL